MLEKRNNLYEKALTFSKSIVLLYREMERNNIERELSKQLLRSGTSVGANIAEAQGSISEADYISKIHIAYKELLESRYWIELMTTTGDIKKVSNESLINQIDELSKILYSIIKKIRLKKK